MLLQRLDLNGAVQATQTWGAGEDEVPSALATNMAGELFVSGTQQGSTRDAAFLLKFNSDLSVAWQVVLPSDSNETAQSVAVLANGDLLVTGSTRDGSIREQLYIARFSDSGSMLWKRVYGQTNDLEGYSAVERPDGGLAVIGYTKAFGLGGQDVYLVLTEPEGWFQQGLTFGTTENDEGRSICSTADGFLIGGTSEGYGPGPAAFHLIRTSFEGSTQGAQVNTIFDPVSVTEPTASRFRIAPNPVCSGCAVSIEGNEAVNSAWTLMDGIGRTVRTGVLNSTATTLELPQLNSGLYLMQLTASDGTIHTTRLVITAP
jgi:hypothetical protein